MIIINDEYIFQKLWGIKYMNLFNLFNVIKNNKDWIFSGIGAMSVFSIMSFCKQIYRSKKRTSKRKPNNKINISNSVIDDSVIGENNIVINNYYSYEKAKENKSLFSERFNVLQDSLNRTRKYNEEEYTTEYISSLIGLNNVNELKQYLTTDTEPDNAFKLRFVDTFGVNREWMLYGRGNCPFASNIHFFGYNAMDILREEKLQNIKRFILVIGKYNGRESVCVIRQKSNCCYEVYPTAFVLDSCVGASGIKYLTELYRFVRESDRIENLSYVVRKATEEQMQQLISGMINPKMVEKFYIFYGFIDYFLNLKGDVNRNKNVLGKDIVCVQNIISGMIKSVDNINLERDRRIIMEGL